LDFSIEKPHHQKQSFLGSSFKKISPKIKRKQYRASSVIETDPSTYKFEQFNTYDSNRDENTFYNSAFISPQCSNHPICKLNLTDFNFEEEQVNTQQPKIILKQPQFSITQMAQFDQEFIGS
jgi:hypothetical protein